MSDVIDIKRDIEPLVASVEAFGLATARADRARLLAQIGDQLEKLRAADEKSRAELEDFYKRVSQGGVAATEAEQPASASLEGERAAAKMLRPRILSLQRYLTGTSLNDDPEAHQLLQEAVSVAVGYVAGYQDLRDQLIRFDVERRATAEQVQRARPTEGGIDHDALSREFMARFPKIRAALAK
jgi:hypothetical protein